MDTLPVAINRSIRDKQVVGWRNVELMNLTLEEIATEIKAGHSFGAQHLIEAKENGKSTKKFIKSRLLILDFDDQDPEILLAKDEVKENIALFYHTVNSTPTKPRFRIAFLLEVPIENEKIFEQLVRSAAWRFNADLDAVDACQMYYGNSHSDPIIYKHILKSDIWQKWINEWLSRSYHSTTINLRFNHLIASPVEVLINCCPFFKWAQEYPDQVSYSLWLALLTNLIDGGINASPYGQSTVNEIRLAFHALSALDQTRYDEQKTNEEFDAAIQRFQDDSTEGYTYRYCVENGWPGFIPPTLSRPAQIVTSVGYKAPKRAEPFIWATIPKRTTKHAEYAEATYSTVLKIFEMDSRQKERFSFNLMGYKVCIDDITLTDADEVRLAEWLTDTYGINVGLDIIRQAVNAVAQKKQFHPVREYLHTLVWDGIERISRIPAEILQTESNELYTLMMRKWLISAVARVMIPGCKVDVIPILVGRQGLKKSTFFRVLASEPWFNDSEIKIGTKDAFQILESVWISEWAELQAYRRTERETLKAFITSQSDSYRPPYAHNEIKVKRTFIIVGTTNDVNFLMDVANRRYWPIMVNKSIDVVLLKQWRDQIWAEAYTAFKNGEEWWAPEELEMQIEEHTAQFSTEEGWEQPVLNWAEDKTLFTLSEVLIHGLNLVDPKDHNRTNLLRVSEILQKNKWQPPTKPSKRGKKVGRFWINPKEKAETFEPSDQETLMRKLEDIVNG